MATVTVTYAVNTNAGAQIRALAKALEKLSYSMPDNVSSGASSVLTIDNAPSTGTASVQITAGPYSGSAILV